MNEKNFDKIWHLKTEPQDETYAAALVKIKDADKYALVNKNGDSLISFDDVETIGNYGGFVKEGEKWGYIDRQGKWVIKPLYDKTWYLSYPDNDKKALGLVALDEKLALINKYGDIIVDFDDTGKFDADKGGYVEKDGKWGFVDTYGNWILPPQLDEEPEFIRGIDCVKSNGKYVFVKENGEFVVDRKFDEAFYFQYYTYFGDSKGTGIAIVRIADLWGFIDIEGKWIMPPQFDDIVVTTDVVDGGRPWVSLKDGSGHLYKNEDSFYIKWEQEPTIFYSDSQIEENLRKEVIKECYVSGVHKHLPDDSEKWDKIGANTEIVLLRDRENKFDPNAVAIAIADEYNQNPENFDFNNIIGYVPKKHNAELAKMLDQNVKNIKAKIVSIKELEVGSPNEKIWIRIWI
ncbi:MAG: WG repeat-containing protein [Muribaculaceae bacterium]|nr:WG repeat-containing protein [Muribaculaceae bacterium]